MKWSWSVPQLTEAVKLFSLFKTRSSELKKKVSHFITLFTITSHCVKLYFASLRGILFFLSLDFFFNRRPSTAVHAGQHTRHPASLPRCPRRLCQDVYSGQRGKRPIRWEPFILDFGHPWVCPERMLWPQRSYQIIWWLAHGTWTGPVTLGPIVN